MAEMTYYTPQEVAEILKVHRRSITRWIREGRLTAVRVGQQYRISKQDLEKFLEQRRTNRKH